MKKYWVIPAINTALALSILWLLVGCGMTVKHVVEGGVDDPTVHFDPIVVPSGNFTIDPSGNVRIKYN